MSELRAPESLSHLSSLTVHGHHLVNPTRLSERNPLFPVGQAAFKIEGSRTKSRQRMRWMQRRNSKPASRSEGGFTTQNYFSCVMIISLNPPFLLSFRFVSTAAERQRTGRGK